MSFSPPNTQVHSKLPPQAVEVEQALLGAALINAHDRRELLTILPNADFFYKEAHQLIWEAIVECSIESPNTDLILVTIKLKQKGQLEIVGGPQYVTHLTTKVDSDANIFHYAMILKESWIKRKLITVCSDTIRDAFEDTSDALEILHKLTESAEHISRGSDIVQEKTVAQIAKEAIVEAGDNLGKPIEENSIFIFTGVPDFDRKMGGYRKGEPDLEILAGRPGMGKSSVLAWECSQHIANNIPVGIVTLEMSDHQLVKRMIVAQSNGQMDNKKLQFRKYNQKEYVMYETAGSKFFPTPCPILDQGGLDVKVLASIAKGWKEKYDIQLLYVDYLQLLSCQGFGDSTSRITEISKTLKKIAKDLHIPVIALASLNRAADTRADHIPNLSDLRESGQIESDADRVRFLMREHYYDTSKDYKEMMMIVAKNRHGETGQFITYFDVATNRPVVETQFPSFDPASKTPARNFYEKEEKETTNYSVPF